MFFYLFTFAINLCVLSQEDKPRPTGLSVRYHGRRVFIGRLCPRLFVKSCIWSVARGAMHRSWQTRTVLLAWSTLSFYFRSSRSLPLTLFFTGEKVFSVASPEWPDNRQKNKVSGRLRELLKKKLSVFFSAGTARSAAAWPPVNCVCIPQLFEHLINTTLCPAFLGKFVCQPICRVPLKYKLFIKILPSPQTLQLYVCCNEFPMPQIDRKSK